MANFNKKRVHKGRIELFDVEKQRWVALAMIPVDERGDIDALDSEQPEPVKTEPSLKNLDVGVLLHSSRQETKVSRSHGWLLGLFVAGILGGLIWYLLG